MSAIGTVSLIAVALKFKEEHMLKIRFVKGAAVTLAMLGMMMPQSYLLADASPAKVPTRKAVQVNRIPDLVLDANRVLAEEEIAGPKVHREPFAVAAA